VGFLHGVWDEKKEELGTLNYLFLESNGKFKDPNHPDQICMSIETN
jgi:hypothetical protein